MMKMLLHGGANPNIALEKMGSPLMSAFLENNIDLVKLLLDQRC
jgi:ankyrin repeat protein